MPLLKSKLINREISWLYFNDRVLQEAADNKTPLIERLKFLGIFSNNQDEFFRVRVATINRLIGSQMSEIGLRTSDFGIGFNPQKTLKEIYKIVIEQQAKFSKIYKDILSNLEKENIYIVNEKKLNKEQGEFVLNYFHKEVRPCIFPIMFKHISSSFSLKNNYIYLIIDLEKKKNTGTEKHAYAIIEVPTDKLPRFIVMPQRDNNKYIIILEDIIRYCLKDIFGLFNYNIYKAYTIKITRDAEIDIDNDISKSFLELISSSVKQRKIGIPVRLIYDNTIPPELLKILSHKFKINNKPYYKPYFNSLTLVAGERYHNFKDFMNFPDIGLKKFKFEEIKPLPNKYLQQGKNFFAAMKNKDILLHFPYNSFDYVIDLLREASIDPKVKSIKMILYRVAEQSNVINALINAARNNKSVTVFIELQARFNEEANIYWTGRLQEEGVKILKMIPGLKVHSKLMLIKRLEQNKLVSYANIATGNYNEVTAKSFADLSLFTSNKNITSEVEKVFYMCEASYKPVRFRHLIVSPINQRKFILQMLNTEIKNAKAGKQAYAIIKLNGLVDENIIKKLYQASIEGVKINLIIRGICSLSPHIKGMSENIEGISIVDRFLEHSRILIFSNAGKEKYYISTADWMTRNLDHRIEVTCPVYDKEIQKYLKDILMSQLSDNVKARIISDTNINEYKRTLAKESVRSQNEIFNIYKQHFC